MARRGAWSRGQRQGGMPLQRLGAPRPLVASSPEPLPHHPGAPGPPGCPGERGGEAEPRAGGAGAGMESRGRGLSQEAPR